MRTTGSISITRPPEARGRSPASAATTCCERAGAEFLPTRSPAWHREHTAADVEHYWTDEASGEEAVAHPEHVARIERVDTATRKQRVDPVIAGVVLIDRGDRGAAKR